MRFIKAQRPVVGVYLPLAGGTMVGDIQMEANKLRTTNNLLKESVAGWMVIRNAADALNISLAVLGLQVGSGITSEVDAVSLSARNLDGNHFKLQARDSGVGLVEIARLVGAADPYFQATLPMRLSPTAAALPAVEGMIGYNSGDDTLRLRRAADEVTFTAIPPGLIAMWHGLIANIPAGWALCDGTGGTPNLIAKFVEGVATAATNPGATGGSTLKTTGGHTHTIGSAVVYTGGAELGPVFETDISTDTIADIRPVFYDIAFIMKT